MKGGHLQQVQPNMEMSVISGPLSQVGAIGHRYHPLDTDGLQPQQHPPYNIYLFPVRDHPTLGHQPPDVLTGCWVGDYSDQRQCPSPCTYLIQYTSSPKVPIFTEIHQRFTWPHSFFTVPAPCPLVLYIKRQGKCPEIGGPIT
jgi:hypothetical protein